MKIMTCNQLGGACDLEFHAETFDEIAKMSHDHGKEMFQQNDESHLNAMREMRSKMNEPDSFQKWMDSKRKEFEALPG